VLRGDVGDVHRALMRGIAWKRRPAAILDVVEEAHS
jgi:hypothetical protein